MERERENIHTSGVLKINGPSLIFYLFFFFLILCFTTQIIMCTIFRPKIVYGEPISVSFLNP